MTKVRCGCEVADGPEPRIWFDKPCWYWYGWRTLTGVVWGGDEWHRRCVMLGWTITGRVTIALWHCRGCKECDWLQWEGCA